MDARRSQFVLRPWKSGRVHLAEGSNVVVLKQELHSVELGFWVFGGFQVFGGLGILECWGFGVFGVFGVTVKGLRLRDWG